MSTQTKSKRPAPQVAAEVRKQYRGRLAKVTLEGMEVGIKISEVRSRYGHVDLLVTPRQGSGERWIQADRVTLSS